MEFYSNKKLANTYLSKVEYKFISIFFYVILLAISAKIKFYLPFSIVPFTFQTLIIFFIIFFEDKKTAFIAISSYLTLGLLNFNVFSKNFGFLSLFGPTGGYLVGFLFASFFACKTDNSKNNINKIDYISLSIRGILALITVYFFGFLGLLRFMKPLQAFIVGVLSFIIFDIYKLIISLFIYSKLNVKDRIS